MTKKNFTEKDLAKIKTVFPTALDVHVEKIRNFGSESKFETYQYVIDPHYETEGEEESATSRNEKRNNTHLLASRYKTFQKNLLEMVKKQHLDFLQNELDPPIIVDANAITRWHPEFNLSKCSEIESYKLPELPNQGNFASAQDVLATAKNLFKNEAEPPVACEPSTTSETTTINPSSKLIKGIPSSIANSLLAKIKQKQATKALNLVTKASTDAKVDAMRLVELSRHIKNIFVTEKRSVLPVELVLDKILNSFGATLNTTELTKDLKKLTEKYPSLFAMEHVRNKNFFRCNRNADFTILKK